MEVLRQSSLKTWQTCRAAFYAEYILGLNLGLGDPNLDFGTYIHLQAENYHKGLPYNAEALAEYISAVPANEADEVERRFEFVPVRPTTGEKLPWNFTGTIDRVYQGQLFDLKTSRSSWSQRRADEDLQATAYSYYWWQTYDDIPDFSFTVLRKDKRSNGGRFPLQTVTTHRTLEDFDRFWLFCYATINNIKRETIWPCTCRDQAHAAFSNQEIYV